MNILIIGGTIFLGRHITQELLNRGHRVTLFHRGHSKSPNANDVEVINGDRDGDLSALDGRDWDAVIDTCAYFPRQVGAMAHALKNRVNFYALISSVNAYADLSSAKANESTPIFSSINSDAVTQLTAETYGPLKAACERRLMQSFAGERLILRPGCIVGPFDQAQRFNYWVRRAAIKSPQIVVGAPTQHWQVIDVRDLAAWLVTMLEGATSGTFNAVGTQSGQTIDQFMKLFASVHGHENELNWLQPSKLQLVKGGAKWIDYAEWSNLPDRISKLYNIDAGAGIAAGLKCRRLTDTVQDVFDWAMSSQSARLDKINISDEQRIIKVMRNGMQAGPFFANFGFLERMRNLRKRL